MYNWYVPVHNVVARVLLCTLLLRLSNWLPWWSARWSFSGLRGFVQILLSMKNINGSVEFCILSAVWLAGGWRERSRVCVRVPYDEHLSPAAIHAWALKCTSLSTCPFCWGINVNSWFVNMQDKNKICVKIADLSFCSVNAADVPASASARAGALLCFISLYIILYHIYIIN